MKKITQSITFILLVLAVGTMKSQPACSGTPATPLVLSSASAVCPSVTVNFSVSNSYTNTGISYQWLSSTISSSIGFATIPGATTAVLSNTNLTSTTWYQLQVTCANGGGIATSANVTVNSLGIYGGGVASITPTSVCAGSATTLQLTAFTSNVNNYSFTTSTGVALLPLTSGSLTLVSSGVDDAPSGLSAIGFPFIYNGVSYTQVSASPDGWIRFGAAGSDEYSNSVTSSSNLPKLYPYWDDIHTGTTGYVRTQTLGSTPNRTMVIEWFVTIPRSGAGSANSTFQAWLVESSNVIQFVYGAMGAGFMSASTGLTGSSSNYNSVTISNNTSSTSSPDNSNSGQPASGRSYLFTPPVAPTYTWASGTLLSSTSAATVTSTPTITAGTFTALNNYSLNVQYQGCVTTKTLNILVANNPTLTLTTTNTNVCSGTSATITASGANTYTWNTTANTSSIVVSPTVNTSYTISARNGACNTASQVISLIASQNPTVTISGPSGICAGQNATLTANGASSYSWNSGSTATTIVDSPGTATGYTVTGTDGLGCKSTATQTVTVAAAVNISITSPSTVCAGQVANLAASGGITYTWSTGATTSTIAPSPTSNTTYSVIGTSGICSNSALTTVSVNPNPTINVTALSNTVCAGTTITLTATGANTYTWSTSSTASAVAVTPTNVTEPYTVTGSGTNGCTTSTVITITTNTVPVITTAQSATIVCVSALATFTASGANTFTWTGGPVNAQYTVTPTAANTTYTVIGTNSPGCSASQTVAIATNSLPVVVISPASSTICATSSLVLSASGSSTYVWNSGPSTSTYVINPTSTTTFTVIGTNSNGCSASQTVAITTNSLPIVAISPASSTICATSSLVLSASGSSTYVWNSGPSTSIYVINPTSTTTYTVIGTNSNGCSASQTVAVVTNTIPVLSITPASATVCSQNPTSFTATDLNPATTFSWSNSTTNPTILVFPSNNPTYTVTGTNPAGCSTSTTVAVTTLSLPVISVAPSLATVCINSATTFTANGAATYTWNNTGTITGSTTVLSPANAVTSYSLSGTSVNGCVDSLQFTVFTYSLPIVSVSASAGTVCAGSPATFTASGANTFSWTGGPVNAQYTVSPPNSTTVYSVSGTNTLTGCVGTQTISVPTTPLPVVTISTGSTTVCAQTSIILTGGGAVSYFWSNASGNSSISATPSITTTYSVTGTGADGCTNTVAVTVNVNALPTVVVTPATTTVCTEGSVILTASGATSYSWIPDNTSSVSIVSTPTITTSNYTVIGTDANGCVSEGTASVYLDACTGIKTLVFAGNLISVYPNPSTGAFTAKFDFEGEKTVTIVNSVGQLITQATTTNTAETFNLSGAPKGIYFVKVSTKHASGNYKIVIE